MNGRLRTRQVLCDEKQTRRNEKNKETDERETVRDGKLFKCEDKILSDVRQKRENGTGKETEEEVRKKLGGGQVLRRKASPAKYWREKSGKEKNKRKKGVKEQE